MNAVAGSCALESEFFDGAGELRQQLERALAIGNGCGALGEVALDGAYRFLMATADRVFAHDLVLRFLARLRKWSKEALGTTHVSTPQIHVYLNGCRRELAPDRAPAQWHYLYSLTRGDSASIRLLSEDTPKWLPMIAGRVAKAELNFNQLLVHDTHQAYAVDGPRVAIKPLEGAILLHGYMW